MIGPSCPEARHVDAHDPGRRDRSPGRNDWRAPFVALGFASAWPAFARWDADYLRSTVGDQSIEVEVYPTPLYSPKVGETEFPKRRMRIADFLEGSRVADPKEWLYAAQVSLHGDLPALAGDIQVPTWVDKRPYAVGFWMGRRGTGTRLHYDPYDNVIGVVRGVKRFSLFPPARLAGHHPYSVFSRWGHFSQVDIDEPDRSRFPDYGPAGRLDFRLAAGQALSLPHGWWHQVINEDDSVAVNFLPPGPAALLARSAHAPLRCRQDVPVGTPLPAELGLARAVLGDDGQGQAVVALHPHCLENRSRNSGLRGHALEVAADALDVRIGGSGVRHRSLADDVVGDDEGARPREAKRPGQ